jgi:hypothetical protein
MYPELNFAKPFSKLKELFRAYNKVVKDRHPQQYKKLSLKSTQIETMKEILRFYGAHLYKNKNRKLSPNRRFWITNTGIAKHKLQHRSTIYRDIIALQQAGVITNKIFHGSNCGVEIEINPYILIYKNTMEDNKQWIEKELVRLENEGAKSNHLIATSLDTNPRYFLYNINKNSGNVESEKASHLSPETFCQKQG